MSASSHHAHGVLDTSVVIDLSVIPDELLPITSAITAITLAELSHGPHTATEPAERIKRRELLQDIESRYPAPLAFGAPAARRYGSLVALIVAKGRSPRSRRMDLMIAAIASTLGIPLFTRNRDDFIGLESAVEVVAV